MEFQPDKMVICLFRTQIGFSTTSIAMTSIQEAYSKLPEPDDDEAMGQGPLVPKRYLSHSLWIDGYSPQEGNSMGFDPSLF